MTFGTHALVFIERSSKESMQNRVSCEFEKQRVSHNLRINVTVKFEAFKCIKRGKYKRYKINIKYRQQIN